MSDKEEKNDGVSKELINAGVEVVKTVYNDALQPAAKEIGKTLGTLGKTINVVLSPIRGMVWSWEQIESYVIETVEQKLKEGKVPEERIIPPDPDIAVPAIEALRYSKLRENYAKLLAASMDSNVAREAHPSFVEILKQLTPDEAKILNFMAKFRNNLPLMDLVLVTKDKGEFMMAQHMCTLAADAKCEYAESVPKYINNLCRLGLCEIPALQRLADDKLYENIKQLDDVKKFEAKIPPDKTLKHVLKVLELTVMGKSFCNVCITTLSEKPLNS